MGMPSLFCVVSPGISISLWGYKFFLGELLTGLVDPMLGASRSICSILMATTCGPTWVAVITADALSGSPGRPTPRRSRRRNEENQLHTTKLAFVITFEFCYHRERPLLK